MKSLITGGAGFIGSHLADALVNLGHQVIILDNLSTGHLTNLEQSKNKIQFVNIDVSDNQKTIDQYFKGVDWVFHMAGLADVISSIKEPDKYFKANVIGTLNVLNAAKKNKVKKFLYAASASCYGVPDNYPTSEESKIDPKNPYALTKTLGEQLVMHWFQLYSMPNIRSAEPMEYAIPNLSEVVVLLKSA